MIIIVIAVTTGRSGVVVIPVTGTNVINLFVLSSSLTVLVFVFVLLPLRAFLHHIRGHSKHP